MLAAWVIGAPFAVMALVSNSGGLNRTLARFHWLLIPLGWIALAILVCNAIVLGEARSELALWIAAPLAGLSIWVRGRGDDGWDPPPEPDPEPDGDPGYSLPCQRRMRPPLPSPHARGPRPARRQVRTRVR